jgi:hypothetical protein
MGMKIVKYLGYCILGLVLINSFVSYTRGAHDGGFFGTMLALVIAQIVLIFLFPLKPWYRIVLIGMLVSFPFFTTKLIANYMYSFSDNGTNSLAITLMGHGMFFLQSILLVEVTMYIQKTVEGQRAT